MELGIDGPMKPGQRRYGGYGTLPPLPFNTFGSAASSGGSGSSGSSSNDPSLSNSTYSMSPDLREALDALKARSSVDTTQRAIDRATTGTMDAAALAAADLKGNLSRRGLVGGGTAGASFLNKAVYQPAQRNAASAASATALGGEQRLDQLAQSGVNAAAIPENLSLANRSLGLQQWNDQQNVNLQQTQLANQMQQQQVAQWLALMGM